MLREIHSNCKLIDKYNSYRIYHNSTHQNYLISLNNCYHKPKINGGGGSCSRAVPKSWQDIFLRKLVKIELFIYRLWVNWNAGTIINKSASFRTKFANSKANGSAHHAIICMHNCISAFAKRSNLFLNRL